MNAYAIPGIPDKIERICNIVAAYYGYTFDELVVQCRHQHRSIARQVTWYLLNKTLGIGWRRIGEVYQRDHSTVMKGAESISREMDVNPHLREAVETITLKIKTV